jgi:CxxC motif-containing protein (DUF1111 family)
MTMKRIVSLSFLLLFILMLTQCRKIDEFPEDQFDERLSGGSQTVFDATSHAFTSEFSGLSANDSRIHALGDGAFEQSFVTAPSTINNGLGPAFNNVSCRSCHHNDGKGVPTAGDPHSSLLMRISYPGTGSNGEPLPVPGYGTQIQDQSIYGKYPEARVIISYINNTAAFADGEQYTLSAPTYTLSNLHVPINGNYLLSPRLAPPVFGLGLLEAIPEEAILQNADPSDANGDGISGKPNYVWDPLTQRRMLGRFGLKANTATLLTQVAAAYNNDIGITSSIFPMETVHGQPQMDEYEDDYELHDEILNAAKFYVQTLQVPARRNVTDEEVIKGKKIFMDAKCGSCHVQTFNTAVNVAFPPLSNQRIHPYTDLLLHDMGSGLADNRPDFEADGNEWRTPTLWGLGLFETVNYPAYYLHDGRANTIMEAICNLCKKSFYFRPQSFAKVFAIIVKFFSRISSPISFVNIKLIRVMHLIMIGM